MIKLKKTIKKIMFAILTASLQSAIKEQGLKRCYNLLTDLIPDISQQYSNVSVDTPYMVTNVRSLHCFQISLIGKILRAVKNNKDDEVTIVDIGDSAGTHVQYLMGLYKNIKALSINLDEKAVIKIREKGLEAVHARAEDLESYSVHADIFLSFEMLEHLHDPINFLHKLSTNNKCKAFVITVPYLKQSRVGLDHLRKTDCSEGSAENTHIFELSSDDWKLIFQHTGWSIYYEKIYFQYPSRSLLRFTKFIWKKFDYEGFYGAILVRDNTYSKLYKDGSGDSLENEK